MNPDTEWEVVAPGVLALPTTAYRIRHDMALGLFMVFWQERKVDQAATLDYAKMVAAQHMRDMMAMGYEP